MEIPPEGAEQLRRIRSEAMELILDARWWNENCPDEEPFDIGSELVIVSLCDRGLLAAEADDGDAYVRVARELVEVAKLAALK